RHPRNGGALQTSPPQRGPAAWLGPRRRRRGRQWRKRPRGLSTAPAHRLTGGGSSRSRSSRGGDVSPPLGIGVFLVGGGIGALGVAAQFAAVRRLLNTPKVLYWLGRE